jgi:hypothetical protein
VEFVVDEESVSEMRAFVFSLLFMAALSAAVFVGAAPSERTVAQTPQLIRPFEPAEELVYEAEFSRSLLRKLDVADFKLRASRAFLDSTSEKPEAGRPYQLILTADVSSKGFFTRLFNLNFRERVESTVDPLSFKVERTKIHDEQGKRVRLTETIFDHETGKMSWTVRDPNNPSGEPRNVVAAFSGQIQDVLSAIYFIRTQNLEVGKAFQVSIADGGHVYQVPVKVVEKKRMKTVLGRVNVVRVDPELFGPDRLIDQEKGEFSIWVTDDHRRVPVDVRVKTDYGTFNIRLKRAVFNPPT